MRRSASEIINNLESRIARLEKEAKKTVSFFNFVFDLSKGLGAQEIEVTKSLLKWAWNHRNKGFGLRDYDPDAPIYYCTFTYRKIEVSDTGSIKVDVEITNPLGETLKDTIFGFINMSGKVQFSSKKIARLEKSAYRVRPRTEAQMESYDSEWGRKHHYRVFDTERDVERYIKTEFGLKGFEFERVPNKNYGRYFINLKQVRKAIRWDKMIQVHSLEFDKYWNVEKDAKWLRPSRKRKED